MNEYGENLRLETDHRRKFSPYSCSTGNYCCKVQTLNLVHGQYFIFILNYYKLERFSKSEGIAKWEQKETHGMWDRVLWRENGYTCFEYGSSTEYSGQFGPQLTKVLVLGSVLAWTNQSTEYLGQFEPHPATKVWYQHWSRKRPNKQSH